MITPFVTHKQRFIVLTAVTALALGCGDNDHDPSIEGPDFPTGPGRLYTVQEVSFPSVDGLSVAAFYGRAPGDRPHPVVILLHDVGSPAGAQEWLFADLFETLLENGYNALAIDLRGHGATLLPDDGRTSQQLLLTDLEEMHLDVRAGITWLRNQQTADNARIGVIGSGIGGNVAYVSMGAFPEDLRVGVALSPGFWTLDPETLDLLSLVIGAEITPFEPHTILYVAGTEDFGAIGEARVSYSEYASFLAAATLGPEVLVYDGVSDHGLALLDSPGAVQRILDWLQAHL